MQMYLKIQIPLIQSSVNKTQERMPITAAQEQLWEVLNVLLTKAVEQSAVALLAPIFQGNGS